MFWSNLLASWIQSTRRAKNSIPADCAQVRRVGRRTRPPPIYERDIRLLAGRTLVAEEQIDVAHIPMDGPALVESPKSGHQLLLYLLQTRLGDGLALLPVES
ncbi:hypothetical protein WOLCODRAFT_149228 [Wolfiporia cocos MD-104 SS10]|uniref:Uncharacterized protein n=1 Tax=Wolfiporia cocos (strain MD-104) TaxID=742152 RepID=A0A2H3JNR4_WOLCO|nr:hypothetical protein WOLCODRAFT_149228 [Wolfiporia cocos MD-104 SS10]